MSKSNSKTRLLFRTIGLLIAIVGFIGLYQAIGMDTTVTGKSGRTVHNIGLLNDKTNSVIAFSVIGVTGVIVFLFSFLSTTGIELPIEQNFTGTRELSEDKYRIYLISKYRITRNEILNKFEWNNRLYDSVDEILPLLHNADIKKQEEELEKAKAIKDKIPFVLLGLVLIFSVYLVSQFVDFSDRINYYDDRSAQDGEKCKNDNHCAGFNSTCKNGVCMSQ